MDEIFRELHQVLDEMLKGPKPDDPKSQSPCSKCVGRGNGCTIMMERDPSVECGAFAKVGENIVRFDDGSEGRV